MRKKQRIALRIVVIFVAFFLLSNAIATKFIYDFIFGRYDGTPNFDVSNYSDIMQSRESIVLNDDEKGELQVYFYDVENEKGLVVIAPGLHAGADDYLPITSGLLDNGYDVVSFDPLGSVNSGGKSSVGFSQEIFDLERVLSYVKTNMSGEEISLIGHSRGGFAVCSMIGKEDVNAVVSIAGLNSAMEAVIGLSERYVGKIANANYFNLWLYQIMLFGKDTMDLKADRSISGGDVPVLIIQGSEDHTAPTKQYSIYSHKADIDGEVSYMYLEKEGQNGHTDIMFDEDGYSVNPEMMDCIIEFLDK